MVSFFFFYLRKNIFGKKKFKLFIRERGFLLTPPINLKNVQNATVSFKIWIGCNAEEDGIKLEISKIRNSKLEWESLGNNGDLNWYNSHVIMAFSDPGEGIGILKKKFILFFLFFLNQIEHNKNSEGWSGFSSGY